MFIVYKMSVRDSIGYQGFGVPVGTVLPFAGQLNKIPVDYLLCDGSAYSAVEYPVLFSIIGDIFPTTLPNLVNRYLKGQGGSSGTPNVPSFIGEATFTLTQNNIPVFTADVNTFPCNASLQNTASEGGASGAGITGVGGNNMYAEKGGTNTVNSFDPIYPSLDYPTIEYNGDSDPVVEPINSPLIDVEFASKLFTYIIKARYEV